MELYKPRVVGYSYYQPPIGSQKWKTAVNMAAAYSALTVTQLKGMLDAAYATHRREMEETRAKWAAEVAALREAFSQARTKLVSELQFLKSDNAALQRELNAVHAELEKANAVIVDQGRKLTAHSEVADLEKRLQIARRMAS
jgi:septal ring factor EnvC (AmiA/AmiB activator)